MDPEVIARWSPRLRRFAGSAAITAVLGGTVAWGASTLMPGPSQPIPFSHRLHAGNKGISCLFCHPDADRSASPGMPQVDKCLLCHNVIIPDFPPIRKLRAYRDRNQGVPWQRVNLVPDFVFFNHQIHLARGKDCGDCHGDVKEMDRITEAHRLDMGFCVNCHKANGASTDCNTCHR